MSTRTKTQSIGYEALEGRQLLAGDVTIFENVHLYIRGDAADNQVEVVAEGDQLVFNGIEGTTINGQDSYVVKGATVTDSGVTFEGGLRANFGPGHDDFKVQDAIFESMSVIFGGTGDDNIDVVDSAFMDKLVMQTYDGNDAVSTTRSHFEGPLFIMTLDGQDSVSLTDSMFAGDSFVVTGNHSDAIVSDGNHYMGDLNLVLPLDGDDTVELMNPVVGEHQLGIFLGKGDDTINVDMTEATVEGTVRIGGQAGRDVAPKMEMSEEMADKVTVGTMENLVVFDNEVVVEAGAHSYEAFGFVASRVTLEQTTRIREIGWTGSYFDEDLRQQLNFDFPDDVFTIEIFESGFYDTQWDGRFDAPVGEALATFNVGNDVNRTDTGEVLGTDKAEITQPIFSYSAEIDFEMEAGRTYWISIHAEDGGNPVYWTWGFERTDFDYTGVVPNNGAFFSTGRNNQGELVSGWTGGGGDFDLTLRS